MAAGLVFPLVVENRGDAALRQFSSMMNAGADAADRFGRSLDEMSAIERRAVATATQHAEAVATVERALTETVGTSSAVQRATLGVVAAQDRLTAAFDSGSVSTARLADLQSSLIGAEERLAAAEREAAAAASTTAAAQREGTAASTGFFASFTDDGGLLKMAGELGLLFGAVEAVKGAIDMGRNAASFSRQMELIQTQTHGSTAEVKNMSSALLGMAGKVGQAPQALAQSLYHFESIGQRGSAAMHDLTIAAKGATIGNADLEDTTNALTYTLQSGITGVHGLGQAMAVFNRIVGSGDMTMQQLVEAIGSHGLLANAKASGASITEVGAALAVLGDNGVKGVNASTAINQILNDMLKPAASGAAAMNAINLSASALRSTMESKGLNATLQTLSAHLNAAGDSGTKLRGALADMFTKKASGNLAIVLGNMDLWNQKLAANTKSAGSFSQAWEQTSHQASVQFQMLGAQLDAIGISLIGKVTPAFGTVASVLANTLRGALTVTENVLGPFGVELRLIGSVLDLVGDGLKTLGDVLHPIAPELKAVAGFAEMMFGAFAAYNVTRVGLFLMARAVTGVGFSTVAWARTTLGSNAAVIESNEAVAASEGRIVVSSRAAAGSAGGMSLLASGANRLALGIGAAAIASQGLSHLIGAVTGNNDWVTPSGPLGQLSGSISVVSEKELPALGKELDKARQKKIADADSAQTLAQKYVKLDQVQQVASSTAQKYAQLLGVTFDKAGKASVGAHQLASDVNMVSTAYRRANGTTSDFMAAMSTFRQSTGSSADRAAIIGATLKANAGDALNFASQINSADTAVAQLGKDVSDKLLAQVVNLSKGTIDYSKSAAEPLIADLQSVQTAAISAAQATYQHNVRLEGGRKAADDAVAGYKSVESSLEAQLRQMGLTSAQAQQLTQRYLGVPSKVRTTIEAEGTDPIVAVLNKIGQLLANLTGQKWTSTVGVQDNATSELDSVIAKMRTISQGVTGQVNIVDALTYTHQKKATGGAVIGAGTATSDSIVAHLSNGEHVWTAAETAAVGGHAAMKRMRVAALARKLPAFAAGGPVYKVGHGWGYDGSYYAKRKDAAAARRDAINNARAAALNPAVSADAAAGLPAATSAYNAAIRSGDLASTRTAYATLLADAKAAGLSKKALEALSTSEKKVIADLAQRAKVTAEVTKAQTYLTNLQQQAAQLRSSVASAITGSFDITTAGTSTQMFNDQGSAGVSASSILTQITAAASKAKAFAALLTRLGREGLSKALISQLAQAGPAAYDQAAALAAATPKQLAAINAQESTLTAAASSAGMYTSSLIFGSKIDAAKALLDGYSPTRNPAMAKAVKQLADHLFGAGKFSAKGLEAGLLGEKSAAGKAAEQLGAQVRQSLKKSLGIASPSRVTRELGRNTGVGFALGLLDSVGQVDAASGRLGEHAAPSGASLGGGSYHHHDGDTHNWYITEADNGMETHHKVMRRLALTGP